jgi:hypothetical protein
LQHKKYKLLLRWAHHCLTSDIVDQVSLKFSPALSKIQFEQENCVKRFQRLDGADHFGSRLDLEADASSGYSAAQPLEPQSALRADDIEVYLRYLTHDEQVTRMAEKFAHRAKWAPVQHRFDIYKESVMEFQKLRAQAVQLQDQHIEAVKAKGEFIIEHKKLGDLGAKELDHIIQSQHRSKQDRKCKNARDKVLATAQYNYDTPPMVHWNQVELKLSILQAAGHYGIKGDIEIDDGTSFSYRIMMFFPQRFKE